MPNHDYRCEECGVEARHWFSIKISPPSFIVCGGCGQHAPRLWGLPQVICSSDPDDVPIEHRVTQRAFGDPLSSTSSIEKTYQADLEKKRKQAKGNRSSVRQTHSIPTELYWGKIKQTGDKRYWDDPSNRNKHRSCKVS